MKFGFIFGAASDTGQLRDINQDSYLTAPGLAIVADGMGGHSGGEIASAIAVQTMQSLLADRAAEHRSLQSLTEAVRIANREILTEAATDGTLQGMGTTVCALSAIDSASGLRLGLINVGDSRAYRFYDGELEQITEDHSLVEVLVRQGRLTPEEAQVHPQRNIVTRALGVGDQVEVDRFEVAAQLGTRYLLCSDGLFNEISDDQIATILAAVTDPDEATRTLVNAANDHGGRDNITAVIVDVVSSDEAEAAWAKSSDGAAIGTASPSRDSDRPASGADDGRRWWQRR